MIFRTPRALPPLLLQLISLPIGLRIFMDSIEINNIRTRLAYTICTFESYIKPNNWFAEEVNDLALKHAGLDDIPLKAMLPLARLSSEGFLDTSTLTRKCGLDDREMEECLEALLMVKLIDRVSTGYDATETGRSAFLNLGKKWITRLRFEYKGRLASLNSLADDILRLEKQ